MPSIILNTFEDFCTHQAFSFLVHLQMCPQDGGAFLGVRQKTGTGTTSGKCLIQVIMIKFYSMMLLGNSIGPFRSVLLKRLKLSNRAVTLH